MKKGQIYEGYVERVDFPNKGIVVVDEKIANENIAKDGQVIDKENAKDVHEKVSVKGTLPGQKVSFVVSKKRNGVSQGRLMEVIEKSPLENNDTCCEHFGKCGGCSYLTMSYENQLKLKEEQVKRLLFEVTGEFTWDGIKTGPKEKRYRNKMEFTFGDEYKGGPLALGMHKKNSFHDIVSLKDCEIVDESLNVIRNITLEYFTEVSQNSDVKFYNRMSHTGQFRHLVLRRSETMGDVMINLVTTSDIKSDSEIMKGYVNRILSVSREGVSKELLDCGITEKNNIKIAGILHTINDSVADVVQADEQNVLYGVDYFYEEILGLRFKITPFSFFQTNTLGASVLYETARGYVGETKDKVIFDLYSGTGTIAQMLAPVAKKVVGVEIVEEAVEAAKINAGINGLDNCEFIAGDVLKVIDDVKDKPDFIVLDPPRDGINPKALSKIIAYGVNQIVYISCKPTSLARDLVVFKANGYEVERGCCVDMFPGTVHVECVTLLQRKNT